jgi:hypothetical protein
MREGPRELNPSPLWEADLHPHFSLLPTQPADLSLEGGEVDVVGAGGDGLSGPPRVGLRVGHWRGGEVERGSQLSEDVDAVFRSGHARGSEGRSVRRSAGSAGRRRRSEGRRWITHCRDGWSEEVDAAPEQWSLREVQPRRERERGGERGGREETWEGER